MFIRVTRRKGFTTYDIIIFTGSDRVPPTGFHKVILNFSSTSPYPLASTCALELTLPTKYEEYIDFKKSLDVAFTMHGGFGMI